MRFHFPGPCRSPLPDRMPASGRRWSLSRSRGQGLQLSGLLNRMPQSVHSEAVLGGPTNMEVRFEVTRYRVNIEVCWDVVAPNPVNFGPKRMPNMRIIGTQKNSWSTTAGTMTQPYPPSGSNRFLHHSDSSNYGNNLWNVLP